MYIYFKKYQFIDFNNKKRFFGMYSGLTSVEAKKLLDKYGYNELKDTGKITSFQILFRQIKSNFVIYLLLAATIISFFVGKLLTAYVLVGVIIVIIATGFVQEYKADQAIKALKQMLMPVSVVVRNGKEVEVDSTELVPGDIIILRTGEKIPADCVLLEEKGLQVNESILTGESREVSKVVPKGKTFHEENLIFMGALIVSGKCVAKVLHTGMNTRFGKVANLISTTEKEMPLQKKVESLAKYMAFVGLFLSLVIGGIIFFRAEQITYPLITEILIIVIAVAVASFPEGFPVVLTTALSLGAYRMAQKNAVINRMSIIETLGETTVICSDKTGTITKGEMTVKKIFVSGKEINVSGTGYAAHGEFTINNKKINPLSDKTISKFIRASVLCNDAIIERTGEDMQFKSIGSPTESALLVMASKVDLFKDDLSVQRIEEVPFTSERKLMSVLCKEKDGLFVYTKGASEILLDKCKYVQKNDKLVLLNKKEKEIILKNIEESAKNAFRTIGIAYKKSKSSKTIGEKDLIYLGFASMEDPPREEVKSALEQCKTAGIKVKMITGDNKETAISIAKQIGFTCNKVLEGNEIDNLTDDELSKIVESINIFARVKPEHKLRIVRALKANGEIVTMTGDGVNDAPSLKEAHIGVAMGKNGTDVSRSVADIVLKDDNFASIVDAITEGRSIFKNIQKFSSYQISVNFAQVTLILFAVLLDMPLPLIAIQILFMNLFSDEIVAITLAFNPKSANIMQVPPRRQSQILNRRLISIIVIAGTIMSLFSLAVFYLSQNILGHSLVESRTLVFLTMVLFGITNAYNFRSFRKLTLIRSPLINKNLFYASIGVFLVTIFLVLSPFGGLFELVPIRMELMVIAGLISLTIIVIFDILKSINQQTIKWDSIT
jgi:P-type Ca2+ transporter type 2C